MRIMIASDIHGSAKYCAELLAAFDRSRASKLFLLGDLLYHGPRNGLCEGYDPKAVADMLNSRTSDIIAIKGNCDSEVDQMVLTFPIMSETAIFSGGSITALFIHGHKNMDCLPLSGIDAVFYGHTHIPACENRNGVIFANPGSVSIPKCGTQHGYILLDGCHADWVSLTEEVYLSKDLK